MNAVSDHFDPLAVDCVLPIQEPNKPRGILFFVHPGGLPNSGYRKVASALPDYAAYCAELGMDFAYMQGKASAPANGLIKELSERLCARLIALLATLPENAPVLLGGWSFGGVIAFEMAADWPDAATQPHLFLLDSIAPVERYGFGRQNLARRVVALWFIRFFNALRGADLRLPSGCGDDEDSFIRALFEQAQAQRALPRGTSEAGFRKLFRTYIAGLEKNSRLTAAHTARSSPVAAILFRARRGLLKRFWIFRSMGWNRLVARLSIVSLPGDHYSILVRPEALAVVGKELAGLADQAMQAQSNRRNAREC